MLVSLPRAECERYDAYRGNGQSRLLQAVKAAVSATYPRTSIRADGQVVVVDFSDGVKFELLPAFARSSWSGEDFDYPDSNMGGRWLSTNPRAEQAAMKEKNDASNGLLLDTCKHMRKIHEKQAEICSSHATKLNVASIAATALTRSGALGLFALTKGMSLIGPRPERPVFCQEFEEIHGWNYRTFVRPGSSGLAQVTSGYDLLPKEKVCWTCVELMAAASLVCASGHSKRITVELTSWR